MKSPHFAHREVGAETKVPIFQILNCGLALSVFKAQLSVSSGVAWRAWRAQDIPKPSLVGVWVDLTKQITHNHWPQGIRNLLITPPPVLVALPWDAWQWNTNKGFASLEQTSISLAEPERPKPLGQHHSGRYRRETRPKLCGADKDTSCLCLKKQNQTKPNTNTSNHFEK